MIQELKDREALHVTRVMYAQKNKPYEIREYRVTSMLGCPVGDIKDWINYARENNYDTVVFNDIDGILGKVFELVVQ